MTAGKEKNHRQIFYMSPMPGQPHLQRLTSSLRRSTHNGLRRTLPAIGHDTKEGRVILSCHQQEGTAVAPYRRYFHPHPGPQDIAKTDGGGEFRRGGCHSNFQLVIAKGD
uniref:Uncharacterized protein n=1 Tax=Pseudomonas extremaustralis TaxID=359110 RepID=A0AEG2_9PSED|nr:hypothetical protein [Pseudomonas extremaustralis 14-3]